MTLKEILINNFLKDDRKNYAIYGTHFGELSQMYDKVFDAIKRNEDFTKFLMFENALTHDGKIKADRLITYFDKEVKKEIKLPVVFKYVVYNYFYSGYFAAMERIKEKRLNEPMPTPPPQIAEPHWNNN